MNAHQVAMAASVDTETDAGTVATVVQHEAHERNAVSNRGVELLRGVQETAIPLDGNGGAIGTAHLCAQPHAEAHSQAAVAGISNAVTPAGAALPPERSAWIAAITSH